MKKVVVERKWKKKDYTIGRVFIDGTQFCNSMEDTDRGLDQNMSVLRIKANKIFGKTAIPTGHYVVKMTYSPKYGRMMPEILNVKGFSGIRIHSGNTAEDTLGCILLGKNTKPGWISESCDTCRKFEELLIAAGGTCELEIR